MSRFQKLVAAGAGALVVAIALGSHYEGTRLHAYRDVGGVWTICTGHTAGVKPGDIATPGECQAWLSADMAKANAGIKACITKPITAGQETALTDFAYNIGVPRACGSTLVHELNAGAPKATWCAQLKRWIYAAGKPLPGLIARRQSEYELCMR